MVMGIIGRMPMPRFWRVARAGARKSGGWRGDSLFRRQRLVRGRGHAATNNPLSSSSIGGLSFARERFRRSHQLASLCFSPSRQASAERRDKNSSHVTRHFFPPWLGFWLVERRMKKRRQAAALQNGCWRFASSPIFSPRRLVFWWKKAPTVIDRRDNFSSKCSGAQAQEPGFVKALCRVIGPVGTRGSRVRFFLKRASEPLAPTPDPGCSRWKLVEYRAGTA